MSFVVIQFKTKYNANKPVDYVEIAPTGEGFDRTRTWHRIKDIKPPENPIKDSPSHMVILERWKIIEPHYEAWKQGTDIPEEGTPLAAWSAVSPEQAQVFLRMGIRTVEDVSEMSDSAADKLPFPNKRKFKGLAQSYLDGRSKVETAAEMDSMREKLAAMEEMLAERMAQPTVPAKKPGRPKKTPEKVEST